MLRDDLILLPHEPLVTDKELISIRNVNITTDYKHEYKSHDDARDGLSKVAKAHSKIRKLTRDEFDSIALHELIFTNKADEKIFIAQIILQNSKFVTIPNNQKYRSPKIIVRTKNIVDQKGIGGIDFARECSENVSHGEGRGYDAEVKYWYDGYVLFLSVDPRDGFEWNQNKDSYQNDWLGKMKSFFEEFGHGYRYKENKHTEHDLNYKSFRSHVGMYVVESIPDMSVIENDDKIATECERLYNKYTKRQAMRIDIDDLSAKLSTNKNLKDYLNKLPSIFSSEFHSLSYYHRTIAEEKAHYLNTWGKRADPDWKGYKESKEKRERVNKLFKIHILPEIKKFVAKHGGDSYESSLTKLVEDNIHLFNSNKVDDIIVEIVDKTEPTISIYNTIVSLK